MSVYPRFRFYWETRPRDPARRRSAARRRTGSSERPFAIGGTEPACPFGMRLMKINGATSRGKLRRPENGTPGLVSYEPRARAREAYRRNYGALRRKERARDNLYAAVRTCCRDGSVSVRAARGARGIVYKIRTRADRSREADNLIKYKVSRTDEECGAPFFRVQRIAFGTAASSRRLYR